MFQVQYRWRISGEESAFVSAWMHLTQAIIDDRRGSHGSILSRTVNDDRTLVANAFWNSQEDWVRAQAAEPSDERSSALMSGHADLESTQLFELMIDMYIGSSGANGLP